MFCRDKMNQKKRVYPVRPRTNCLCQCRSNLIKSGDTRCVPSRPMIFFKISHTRPSTVLWGWVVYSFPLWYLFSLLRLLHCSCRKLIIIWRFFNVLVFNSTSVWLRHHAILKWLTNRRLSMPQSSSYCWNTTKNLFNLVLKLFSLHFKKRVLTFFKFFEFYAKFEPKNEYTVFIEYCLVYNL